MPSTARILHELQISPQGARRSLPVRDEVLMIVREPNRLANRHAEEDEVFAVSFVSVSIRRRSWDLIVTSLSR